MSSVLPNDLEQLLVDAGFIRDGRRVPGLLDEEGSRISVTADLRYHRLIAEDAGLGVGATIDLVYESPNQGPGVPGIPCIYFKFLQTPSPDIVRQLRNRVWNHGRSPTYWIVSPQSVRVYDGFARPDEADSGREHLLAELKRVQSGFQGLASFHKSEFDSGAFWESPYGSKVKRSQRVDRAMLGDLQQAEALLIGKTSHGSFSPLAPAVAHALLGRSIFVSYLLDRRILSTEFFQENYQCETFSDLLGDVSNTFSFFEWLGNTFNGDLFPLKSEERESVQPQHLGLIQAFLRGADLAKYPVTQGRLWPYRFDVIPVELVSSIYEMFAYSFDPKGAEARSVHYTQLPVVELLLSLAMNGVSHTARVLDPACGSGVFLVEAFRRLAWMRAHEYGHLLNREELHDLIRSQIFGIDIDAGAVQVAAFSLYLTLLELDPDPQPPAALKFPPLQKVDATRRQGANLYAQDFCNASHEFNRTEPFASKRFDLIVGNPPWTGLTPRDAPRDPEQPTTGRQWSLEYCLSHQIPDRNPDQAFMQRARDFARPEARIAFIIGSRLFAQQAAKREARWLTRYLGENTVDTVVNLSDLVATDILFGGTSSTRLPASIIIYRVGAPTDDHSVLYLTPMWNRALAVRGEIAITSSDISVLSQAALKESPFLWKSAFRGTPRDYRLLRKLEALPSLEQVLAECQLVSARGFTVGKGVKKRVPQFRDLPFLPSRVRSPYRIGAADLELFGDREIAARSNVTAFELPALILYRSLVAGRASVALIEPFDDKRQVVIDQMYNAVSLGQPFAWLGYRLNALLNSRMALYLAFMFSSNLGWNWKTFEQTDFLQIRLPVSILDSKVNSDWQDVLRMEELLRTRAGLDTYQQDDGAFEHMQAELDNAVYRLYGLSEQERVLVEDTVRYNIELLTQRKQKKNRVTYSEAFQEPSIEDLRVYTARVSTQLNAILRYGNLRLVPTIATFDGSTALRACHFAQRPWTDDSTVSVVLLNGTEDLLARIATDLRLRVADHLHIERDLRVYTNTGFWIIKPAEKRLWSEAVALNDADSVLAEHMEASIGG